MEPVREALGEVTTSCEAMRSSKGDNETGTRAANKMEIGGLFIETETRGAERTGAGGEAVENRGASRGASEKEPTDDVEKHEEGR